MTPRGRCILLFALVCVPMGVAVWVPDARAFGLWANVVLVVLALVDILLSPAPRKVLLERDVYDVLSVGTENPVVLRARNRSRSRLRLELTDEPPQPSATKELPQRLVLGPGREGEITYHVEPHRRGRGEFTAVHVRYPSVLGLWTFYDRRPIRSSVRIYPDIRAVRRFDLLARRDRFAETGFKVWRLRGQGGEFDRLREYRREDERRHVDWKATAKHQRLISREYTVERNQNVLLLIDCGRSMGGETDGISHLDRGLNAAIILSYVALGQGDKVGLLAFSNRVERAIAPVRGKRAIQSIIRSTFDLEPRWEAADYGMACDELVRRQRQRSLVVLITHTLDEQHLLTIGTYARAITSNHILLCALLRDVAVARLARRVPSVDVESFHVAAAAEHLVTQAKKIEELRDRGVLVLDVLPSQLSSGLVNEYLDLKARHLL